MLINSDATPYLSPQLTIIGRGGHQGCALVEVLVWSWGSGGWGECGPVWSGRCVLKERKRREGEHWAKEEREIELEIGEKWKEKKRNRRKDDWDMIGKGSSGGGKYVV